MKQFENLIIWLLFTPLLILSHLVLGYDRADNIRSWCATTPHPKPCEYHISQNPNNTPINSKSDFLNISLHAAFKKAEDAQKNIESLGPKCRNNKEKAAWKDCCKLYTYAVSQLNRTTNPNPNCTVEDTQTRLSTALTHIQTCRVGFIEFGITDNILPMMSNNVSQLISNALAINAVPGRRQPPSFGHDRLPSWVMQRDRKLLQLPLSSVASEADVVVAKDGSGDYETIAEAVTAASKRSGSGRYVIYIRAGIYNENVEVPSNVVNIMFVGDGIGKSIVTGSRSVGGGSTTFNSATVAIVGDGFIGRGMTFSNTAGAANHQAVALRSGSDLSVFYECSFEGYQDTLYVHSERQFFRKCNIYGTVDFIFGNAAVVIQKCNIYARYPPGKTNTITAQGRTDPNQNTGISILKCKVMAGAELEAVESSVHTYLGRPWKKYSRTVFMETYLGRLIDRAGWLEWDDRDFGITTLFYGEYKNTGPGSSIANRVTWPGYHPALTTSQASKFTVNNFIGGDSWLPQTEVPYTSGL